MSLRGCDRRILSYLDWTKMAFLPFFQVLSTELCITVEKALHSLSSLCSSFSFQISASMCRTLPSPCSSARSRKKETLPQHTVSITDCMENFPMNLLTGKKCIVCVCVISLISLGVSPIRDDGGGSGNCSWYSHPGADRGHGECSLPTRTRRHHSQPEQLLKTPQ